VFQTSRDDGATWSKHVVPSTIDGPSLGAHDLNPVAVSSSLAFQPYLAQDPTRAGRYAVMYFGKGQTALLVQVTSDSGRTWTKPVRLAEKGGVQHWLPWIAYGTGGALGVTWRTTYGQGSYATWAAVSRSGTTAFAAPVRLSSKLSPGPVSQVAGDDNSHVALDRSTLHAVWGDRREGPLGIHYARYRFAADPAVRADRPGTSPALGSLPATGSSAVLVGFGAAVLSAGLLLRRRRG
jgi:LPXTG-motif cell wall-anchored protein